MQTIAGSLLFMAALYYGGMSTSQVFGMRSYWMRRPVQLPSQACLRSSGLIGVGIAALTALLGFSELAASWSAVAVAGMTAVVLLSSVVVGLSLVRRLDSGRLPV